jgi:creatinine amidohydrolase/Fe(II)-dependent formamide hydrolase-like protein
MAPLAARPYILNELTWKTVRDARYEVAVLPWGATEAHNLHLPYSTDNVETERIAALAAQRATARVNWYQIVDPKAFFSDLGDHAGELETSVMLHLAPELVRPLSEAGPGRARRFTIAALRDGWAWAPRRWRQVTDDTGVGDPAAATVDKGRTYVDAVSEKIASFLVELAQADPGKLYE